LTAYQQALTTRRSGGIGIVAPDPVDALAQAGEGGDTSMAEEAVKKQALELCGRFPIY
jgi:hypothetical protein